MYISDFDFNYARKCAFNAFVKTMEECYKQKGISEKLFSEIWLKNMSGYEGIIAEGWYNPPPKGIAVLSGSVEYPSRISYDSLRNEKYWPSDNIINWESDLFYFYCSPLSQKDGLPGDFTITLYFGDDVQIKNHFKNTFRVTNEILNSMSGMLNSYELFCIANEILEKNKLLGCGISSTDPALTNFGHTLPNIDLGNSSKITDVQIKTISQLRKFINSTTNWFLECNQQFTFEPQLRANDNIELPQVSYHYLINKVDDKFLICDDVNSIIKKFDLC